MRTQSPPRSPISRRTRTAGAGLALILAVTVVLAAPAAAGVGPGTRDGARRHIGIGNLRVEAGESVEGPLVGIDGRARVDGTVDGRAFVVRGNLVVSADGVIDGDVIVVRGDARIDGRVNGNVTVIGGQAVIGAGAVVRGDVSSTDDPKVDRDAQVTGDVRHIDVAGIARAIGTGVLVFWWIAVTVCTAVLGALVLALFPRGLEATAGAGRRRTWRTLLIGLGLLVGLPVVAVAALSTLVGLPLGLGGLGALGLVHALGYVAAAFALGRAMLKAPKNRFGAFFVGWVILRVLAVVPVLGVLVWIVAAAWGMGMLAVAGFAAGRPAPPGSGSGTEPAPIAPIPEPRVVAPAAPTATTETAS